VLLDPLIKSIHIFRAVLATPLDTYNVDSHEFPLSPDLFEAESRKRRKMANRWAELRIRPLPAIVASELVTARLV
jgi:hypothetical protein